jgi:2-C-methyl-D-erythritol 4-phosphate cytidylyltransferase
VKWAAAIVAAGRGRRFGRPKQFVELAGFPMVGWSIRIFAAMPEIAEIVVATEPESLESMRELLALFAPQSVVRVVRGGAIRQQSVYEAVRAVSEKCDAVLVHDGARPLVRSEDVRAGMREVRARRASLLAVPVVDTIKRVEPQSRRVDATLDRATLWAAQTPQFGMRDDLLDAHARARQEGIEATDDAALLERAGVEVVVVHSTGENFKVTMPGDVERAAAILQARE